ncbi:uncharacterized protein VP01_3518g2 [Puccinia sorghi]|uniref:Uncharacterized protein n=1 Tax=Puccinia sorghi TaxID=27349 RepID=A0A0L6UXI6_9BASI|nr:uncharacterized protein VP01_3518g2 [Puccinia sorghi]
MIGSGLWIAYLGIFRHIFEANYRVEHVEKGRRRPQGRAMAVPKSAEAGFRRHHHRSPHPNTTTICDVRAIGAQPEILQLEISMGARSANACHQLAKMRSSTFNFLLVALVVVLVDAAPQQDTAFFSPGSAGEEARIPRGQSVTLIILRWDDNQSDWNLLATGSAETSEHPTQDKKKAPLAGSNSTRSGSKDQPPAAVLKTLCDLLLSGYNSGHAPRSHEATVPPSASSTAGDKKDSWSSGTGSSADKTTGIADDQHDGTTRAHDPSSSMPAGAGNHSALAMTWCSQHFGDHLSVNSKPHQVPTINDDKASGNFTPPFSAGNGSKNSPSQSPPTVTPYEGPILTIKPTKESNNSKDPPGVKTSSP